jgi:hypothetical protein
MKQLRHYVNECLTRKLLVDSPIRGVYWTPSIARKLEGRSASTREAAPLLELSDFFVGTYESLGAAKTAARGFTAGMWNNTEIHHIVENYHLQFLGLIDTVDSDTYKRREPCVLLSKTHHNLHMENIIGGAEKVVLEVEDFDFIQKFRDDNPGISDLDKTEQGRRRKEWVLELESERPPRVTRQKIRGTLLEIYNFAYQEPELEPLRLIARAVIRSMPL